MLLNALSHKSNSAKAPDGRLAYATREAFQNKLQMEIIKKLSQICNLNDITPENSKIVSENTNAFQTERETPPRNLRKAYNYISDAFN